MKKIASLFLILLVMYNSACKGPEGDPGPIGPQGPKGDTGGQGPQGQSGATDKQTRIYFPGDGGLATNSVTGELATYHILYDFNLEYYPDADSIVFGAYLQSYNPSVKCIVELYDRTNNVVIQNTQLSSNSSTPQWVTTNTNFIKDLPQQSISLGIRFRSDTQGKDIAYLMPMLVIYRK